MRKRNLISKLLTQQGIPASKAVQNPIKYDVDKSLRTDALNESVCTKYQTIVGSLVYLSTRTKLNLCVLGSTLSSYVAHPAQ